MKLKRERLIGITVLALLVFAGCATTPFNLTPEAKYYTALDWYNDNLELYLTHFKAQTPEVQAEWKAKYHPIFQAGDIALTAWKGKSQGEEGWTAAKKQILAALLTLNIVEVK